MCCRAEEKQRLDSLVLQYEKTIADQSGAMDTLEADLKHVMAQLNDSQRRSQEAEDLIRELEKKRCGSD
jgi:Skp family chaperone for outer membrane proteins